MATFRRRANACDSASPVWLTSSGEAGGQAEAYLPKQPGLDHPSRHKNCHDSTATCRENERVATGRESRENKEVENMVGVCEEGVICREQRFEEKLPSITVYGIICYDNNNY